MKKSFSKIELILMAAFFLCFFIWAASKCSGSKENKKQTLLQEQQDTSSATTINLKPLPPPTADPNAAVSISSPNSATTITPNNGIAAAVSKPEDNLTTLYVTLEGLKMRNAPDMDSSAVAVLKLHEPVKFLNKRTDFRQKINIGTEYAYEPWLYIQNAKGKKGWAFGGGLHYYKWDRLKEKTTPPQE